MLAEIPLMFEGYDDLASQAVLQSVGKASTVFKSNRMDVSASAPYDYMQWSEFLYKTYTRVPRLMWEHKVNPLKIGQLYYLLPFVVEEALSDNLEFFKTLRRSES